ncbi:MAG: hypothetical protein LBK41_09060 [Clostridiales bacterium]|jgi:hypothetical protein|nr:hypothetical protein [Clostridiales bacterium]
MGINVGTVYMDAYINVQTFEDRINKLRYECSQIFDFIRDKFVSDWETMRTAGGRALGAIRDTAGAAFNGVKNAAEQRAAETRAAVESAFNAIRAFADENMRKTRETVEEGAAGWTAAFRTFASYMNGSFSADWRRAWSGAASYFGIVWNGIRTSLAASLNACIGLVNRFVAGVWQGIKAAADMAGSLIRQFGELLGYSDWGFSMPDAPQIPYLAKGGVVQSPTLAMIGERGREAVLPLDSDTGWMDAIADRIARAVGGGRSAKLVVNGRQLAEALFDDIRAVEGRRGVRG